MAAVQIIPVSGRRQQKQFLRLPWQLYRDDPNWIPPLRTYQKELVGFKHHPFHNMAETQAFLALRDGIPSGRVLAIHNRAHNEYRPDEPCGFVGFFESVDDQEVAHRLFDAAWDWCSGRGLSFLRGPTNPSLNYELGLLIDGFDRPPTFQMTYNHAYYPALWESYGFTKSQDLFAYLGDVSLLDRPNEKMRWVFKEAQRRFNLTLRGIDKSRFRQDVRLFLEIYNRSLVSTWGFVPLSDAEVDHMSAGLQHLIIPELTTIAEVDGKPVGASFGMLDYNPIIKRNDGYLFPFGFLRILSQRKRIKRVRLVSTNVLPEYQKWGLGLVVTAHLVPKGLEWGLKEAEFSWVLESNHLSRKSLERGGVDKTNTYRIYDFMPDGGSAPNT